MDLIYASEKGKLEQVTSLLKSGVPADSTGLFGDTPLHAAARADSPEIVTALVNARALVDQVDGFNHTALQTAAFKSSPDAAQALLAAKANTALHHHSPLHPSSVLEIAQQRKAHYQKEDPNCAYTKKRLAQAERTVALLEQALADNAPNLEEPEDKIPQPGAKIEWLAMSNDAKQAATTELIEAVESGAVQRVESLLASGVPADSRGKFGDTPLHAAARVNSAKLVNLLVKEGAVVDQVARLFQTALHQAASHGSPDAARALLAAGANSRLRSHGRVTPLDIACGEKSTYNPNCLSWTPYDQEKFEQMGRTVAVLQQARQKA